MVVQFHRAGFCFTVACLMSIAPAAATELISNGSFESGTFAGWVTDTTGTPFLPWQVSMGGQGGFYGLQATQPQAGQFDAWNCFDGAGPMKFILYWDVKVPLCLGTAAVLRWKDRVQWNFALTGTARTYTVQVRDATGAPATIYSFSTGTARVIGDTGWQSHSANLLPYAGSMIRIWF